MKRPPLTRGLPLAGRGARPDDPLRSWAGGCTARPRGGGDVDDMNARSAVVGKLRAAGCVFAEDEAGLLLSAAQTPAELATMVDRRAGGQPIEHILGWTEFCGMRIAVDPGVFVPRGRTEFLVQQAATLPRPTRSRPVVVDLCCGSGAVGVAVVAALGDAELIAVDIDPAAVRCARRNVASAGGVVYAGDLYDPLPATLHGRVDVLLANVPYVPTGEIGLLPPEAREYEPRGAFDGGADGLDIARRVAAQAPHWLAPGGRLLIETSQHQAPHAAEILTRSRLVPQVARSDDINATIVVGTNARRRNPALPGPTGVGSRRS